MKKIAVASVDELVSEHFGHCKNFNIYDVEDKNIVNFENVPSPGHDFSLPEFLKKKGVEFLITGGMGHGARDECKRVGLEFIFGASGEAKKAVQDYIDGTIVLSEAKCSHKH